MRLGRNFFILFVVAGLLWAGGAGAATSSKTSPKPVQKVSQKSSSKAAAKRPSSVTRTIKKTTTTTTTTRTTKAAPALTVDTIRAGQNVDKTRLVIELGKPADYRLFTMGNPWRLVVDVPPARWRAPRNDAPAGAPLIKQYRSGTLDDGLTRMVFDLAQPAIISDAFFLPRDKNSKDRLVIDLKTASQQVFDQQEKQIVGTLASPQNAADSPPVPRLSDKMSGIETTPIAKDIAKENVASAPAVAPVQQTQATVKPSYNGDTGLVKKSPAAQKAQKKYTVVVDAGHGGEDPGALGDGGIREKNITLAVARELRDRLLQTGRYNVVLTRDRDVYIKLHSRVDISRQKNGDIFISIHADKTDRNAVRGASIYTLSDKASDAETERLAEQENNAGVVAGVDLAAESPDVANILLDLAMREKMNESNLLAEIMQDAFEKENVRLLPNSHRSAGFAVLKAPDVPSILIETGFLSNPEEAKLLSSPPFQAKIADAIADGVDAYFRKIEALQGN